MKSPYVSELQPNQVITATFLVQHKDVRQKRTGEPFLSLVLGDRTGDIEARMWDNVAEILDTFDRDDFVRVRGLLQVHHNRLQLTVHKIQRQPAEQVDFADYFPASERNPDDMWSELLGIVNGIGNPHLKALLTLLTADPDVERRYKIAPAAKNVHHAFLGGLLEHVLSMAAVARMLAAHYKDIDSDLLMTGVLLHDIGKIWELEYDRSFGYSSDGQLLGHIAIGLRLVADKVAAIPGFPPRLRTLVEHMILSHHGELEFGSPKMPMFPEALLLHQIDNLDSKMDCMRALLNKDRLMEGAWTGYSAALDRTILKKRKYLEHDEAPVAEPVKVCDPQSSAAAAPRAASAFAEKLQSALGRKDS
jgi:3'-5' exoribonuclease